MKLIKLQNKFILVSDERITDVRPHKGKWHLEKDNIINQFPTYLTDLSECKLIIAGIPELPITDLSLLKEEDCKRIGWVDIEKLAEQWFLINQYNQQDMIHSHRVAEYITTKNLWITSFKTAQSLNNKQFTLDDMNILANKLINWVVLQKNDDKDIQSKISEIIQSLQKTEWAVEVNEKNQITKIL